jgi:hypothetical protein
MLLSIISKSSAVLDSVIAGWSPLGWWKLDESTGTSAADSGSGGNGGTASAGVLGQAAVYDPALYGGLFDAVSEDVSIAYDASLAMSSARSYACCFYVASTNGNSILFKEGNSSVGGQQGCTFFVRPNDANSVRFETWDGSEWDVLEFAATMSTGKHTLVMSCADTTVGGDVTMYLDGVSLGTQQLASTIANSTQPRLIGDNGSNVGFDGRINHMVLLDRALTSTEASSYNSAAQRGF